MKKEDAYSINKHLERMLHHANHVLYVANNSGDADFKQRVRQVLGDAIAESDPKILYPIYKEFPELRSSDLSS